VSTARSDVISRRRVSRDTRGRYDELSAAAVEVVLSGITGTPKIIVWR